MLARLMKVKDLPPGEHRDHFLSVVQDPDNTTVFVVAKEGYDADWAVYIGWPTVEELRWEVMGNIHYQYCCEMIHTPEQVAELGDKLSAKEARTLFPGAPFARLRYRE